MKNILKIDKLKLTTIDKSIKSETSRGENKQAVNDLDISILED